VLSNEYSSGSADAINNGFARFASKIDSAMGPVAAIRSPATIALPDFAASATRNRRPNRPQSPRSEKRKPYFTSASSLVRSSISWNSPTVASTSVSRPKSNGSSRRIATTLPRMPSAVEV
jgi:hypothetical protein